MKKVGSIILYLFLIVFSSAYAWNENPDEVPSLCPDVEELKRGGLIEKRPYIYSGIPLYVLYKRDEYQTHWKWVFVVAVPQGEVDDLDEAMEQATKKLKNTSGNPTPVPVIVTDKEHHLYKKWLCMYEHKEYFVLAFTPSDLPGIDSPAMDAAFSMNGNIRKFTGTYSH